MAKLKIFVSLILCVLLFTFCVSCTPSYGDEDDFIEKPIYEQVINTTNNIATKSIYSNTNLKFIFYKYDGTPCRINENILLNRMNDGVDQFISLNVHTTEISSYVQDLVNTFIDIMGMNGKEKPLVAIEDFLFGRKFIALQMGKYNDTVNAQIELVDNDSTPLFSYSDDGQEIVDFKGGWGAVKYSDFLNFQQSATIDYLKNFDLLNNIFNVWELPFNKTEAVDIADSKMVDYNSKSVYNYELTYNKDSIINMLKTQFEFYISESFKDNKEDYDYVKGYYDKYVNVLLGLFTIGDFKINVLVDENSRILHTDTSWNVKFEINISQIENIMQDEGFPEENITAVVSILNIVNSAFIGCSNKAKGNFEFGFELKHVEDYDYDNISLDKTSSVFTEYDENEPGRVTIEYIYDNEIERNRWEFVNIPSKVNELYNNDQEAEEDFDGEIQN